jgi:hypothetical protein
MCQVSTEKHLYPWSESNEHSRIQMVVHDSWMLVWRSASVLNPWKDVTLRHFVDEFEELVALKVDEKGQT